MEQQQQGMVTILSEIEDLVHPERQWRNGVFGLQGGNNVIPGSFCTLDHMPAHLYNNHIHLDHPAIAKLCLVSDLGNGTAICGIQRINFSLRVWLERNPRSGDDLPESYRNILRSIIGGMQHAHEQGKSDVALDLDSIVVVIIRGDGDGDGDEDEGEGEAKPKITRVESETLNEVNNDYGRLDSLIRSICGSAISKDDISDLLARCATPSQLNVNIISRHPASWSDLMRQEFILNLAVNAYLSDSLSPKIRKALKGIIITPPGQIYDKMVAANISFFNEMKMMKTYKNSGHGCMRFCRDCYIHLKEGVQAAEDLDPNFSEAYISQKLYEFFTGFFLQLQREFVQQNIQWQW